MGDGLIEREQKQRERIQDHREEKAHNDVQKIMKYFMEGWRVADIGRELRMSVMLVEGVIRRYIGAMHERLEPMNFIKANNDKNQATT